VLRCGGCRHIFVPEGLARAADGLSIYESAESVFWADGNEEYYLDDSNLLSARVKAEFVRRHCPERQRLLDVGSSFGHFLAAADAFYDASGVELSPEAVAWSGSHFGVRSAVGSVYDLEKVNNGPFDIVTAWDVVEHLEDPQSALNRCRQALKPGGWLFLSTPDAGSAVARLMGRYWHYLDPVQHINVFSRSNLVRMLEETGFAVRGVTSFGHHYRLRYVLSRLKYLSEGSALKYPMRVVSGLLGPFGHKQVALKLWDVMGVAAVRAA
jgi:2-polyprenyl-3-methyl-5-hydroxy-6-metoxy-1,4-benzoquinol methylase